MSVRTNAAGANQQNPSPQESPKSPTEQTPGWAGPWAVFSYNKSTPIFGYLYMIPKNRGGV